MHVSPSMLFLGAAVLSVAALGTGARSAPGASVVREGLPADIEAFGFVSVGTARGVVLLEATRDFELHLGNGPVHGTLPASRASANARALLARELDRYPAALLSAIHLGGVVLVAHLHEGTMAIPSLPNVGGLMLLDVEARPADLARAVHHEIFHFADIADDGKLSPDATWQALEPSRFVYGGGGRSLRSPWTALPSELPGFVSAYATSAIEEDKAETFSFVMTRPAFVRERTSTDAVLAGKVHELRERIDKIVPDASARLGFDAALDRRR